MPGPPANPHLDAVECSFFDELDSTSLEARRRISRGESGEPFVIAAGRQTGGMGRRGRPWHSPQGGLWCTLSWPFRGGGPPDGLGLRVGVACLRAIETTLDNAPEAGETRLKWPNDILIDGRKVAGILTETLVHRGTAWVLVGVGINANNRPADLPSDLRRPATSLADQAGRAIDLDDLRACLTRELAAALARSGPDQRAVREAGERLFGVGLPVRADVGEGVLMGLDEQGRPMIRTKEGTTLTPASGEIRFLDPVR